MAVSAPLDGANPERAEGSMVLVADEQEWSKSSNVCAKRHSVAHELPQMAPPGGLGLSQVADELEMYSSSGLLGVQSNGYCSQVAVQYSLSSLNTNGPEIKQQDLPRTKSLFNQLLPNSLDRF